MKIMYQRKPSEAQSFTSNQDMVENYAIVNDQVGEIQLVIMITIWLVMCY